MRNKIKAIIVACAIALSAIGVGTAATGAPVQAASPYLCSVSYYGVPSNGQYPGVTGRCNGGIYRVRTVCSSSSTIVRYGPWKSSNIYSTQLCPSGQVAIWKGIEVTPLY
jgi:hypothetical protein